jgi:hypothetical protein
MEKEIKALEEANKKEVTDKIIQVLTQKVSELEESLFRVTTEKETLLEKLYIYCQVIQDDPISSAIKKPGSPNRSKELLIERLERMAEKIKAGKDVGDESMWTVRTRCERYERDEECFGYYPLDEYYEPIKPDGVWEELDRIRKFKWDSSIPYGWGASYYDKKRSWS